VVPLERVRRGRERAEHGVLAALGRQLDLEPADLGRGRGADPRTGRPCEHLGAEADAEGGDAALERLDEELGLAREPREVVVLVGVHRPAEDEHGVVGGRRLREPAEGDLPALEPVPGRLDDLVEDAAGDVRAVGDGEDAHRGDCSARSRGRRLEERGLARRRLDAAARRDARFV
jgi:hypothetical protein